MALLTVALDEKDQIEQNKVIRQLVGTVGAARETLLANRTYYVRTDGSDNNTGLADTAARAFLTLQAAVNAVVKLDLNGFAVTIQIATGTYSGATVIDTPFVGGQVTILGDATTPSNVVLTASGATALTVANGVTVKLSGIKFTCTGSGFFSGLDAFRGARALIIGKMDWGACTGDHMFAGNQGYIEVTADYNITGNAGFAHWAVRNAGALFCENRAITVSGSLTFASAGSGFADATVNGAMRVGGCSFSTLVATGSKYRILGNGAIFTNFVSGNSYFPGSANGTTDGSGYVK